MRPQDFVIQVFHAQEGVYLNDLWPDDDKYKQVMLWLHRVINEFTLMEDWTYLRRTLELGKTDNQRKHMNKVLAFKLPDNVDRVCTLFDDSLKLCSYFDHHCGPCCSGKCHKDVELDERNYISVPYASRGAEAKHNHVSHTSDLFARVYDKYIELNRVLRGNEMHRIALCDVQVKPHLPHICDDTCKDKDGNKPSYFPTDYRPCTKIEDNILTEFPKTDYFIFKTAYYSSMFSPVAAAVKMDLDNTCKTILSNLRKVDTAKTHPDIIENKATFRPIQVL